MLILLSYIPGAGAPGWGPCTTPGHDEERAAQASWTQAGEPWVIKATSAGHADLSDWTGCRLLRGFGEDALPPGSLAAASASAFPPPDTSATGSIHSRRLEVSALRHACASTECWEGDPFSIALPLLLG